MQRLFNKKIVTWFILKLWRLPNLVRLNWTENMEIPIMTNVLHHCDILITYILNRNDGNKMLISICSLEKYVKSPIRGLKILEVFTNSTHMVG